MAADLAIKEPCLVATTGNITLSGLQTIDGVAVAANDRVLVRAQSTAANNGIYLASAGAWTRALDMDGAGEAAGGTQLLVTSGTTQAGNSFRIAGSGAITIGTTAISFEPAVDAESVNFLPGGSGAVARTADSKLREQPLTPEDFGAAGDGTTNDSGAFSALLAAAQSLALPIRLRQGATYGLGSTGWTGIAVTLSRNLVVDGNRATLKVLVQPAINTTGGTHYPVFRFDGTSALYRVAIRDVSVDFGATKANAFDAYQCEVDFRGCRFTNGDVGNQGSGDMAICFYLNKSRGVIEGNYCKNAGYFVYGGHTDADMYSSHLRIVNNFGEEFHVAGNSSVRGDPHNGVIKHSLISGNTWKGFFGVGLSGSTNSNALSEDVIISNNELSNFIAAGAIQPGDVAGAAKNRNITIVGNTISNPDNSQTSCGVYAIKLTNLTVAGNTMRDVRIGVLLDGECSRAAICGNTISASGSSPLVGINLTGEAGTVEDVEVSGNFVMDFPANIAIGGANGDGSVRHVRRINVSGNSTTGGARGIYLQNTLESVFVAGNSFSAASSYDIDNSTTNAVGRVPGLTFGRNLFSTVNGGVSYSATYDPPNLANGAQQSTTLTPAVLTAGDFARLGDLVQVSFSLDLQGTRMWAEVTGNDTIKVYHRNDTGAAVNLGSGTLRVEVMRQ